MDELKTDIIDASMFINRVDYELKRAERYSIFMSLVVYDMSLLRNSIKDDYEKRTKDLYEDISEKVRKVDIVSLLGDSQIALLCPETNRQGAEIVSKRIYQIIKENIKDIDLKDYVIPMEIASYPDTTGTTTISQFLHEYGQL